MRIAAMGAGGVGGYFGARLQQAGHEVVYFARGKHLAALKENGLTLRSPHGAAQLRVQVFERPAEAGAPVDVVMFAVKLWDTESAAELLRPVVGPKTIVIPFQNGVESVERLKKIFPAQNVLGGSAYIATRIAAPGVIEHIGQMAGLEFGPLMPSQHAAAAAFHGACQAAGINAKLADDIQRVIWQKFIFLVAVSGCTASARVPPPTPRNQVRARVRATGPLPPSRRNSRSTTASPRAKKASAGAVTPWRSKRPRRARSSSPSRSSASQR